MEQVMRKKHYLGRIGTLVIMASAFFMFNLSLESCSKEDSANPVHNHRPAGDNDGDNHNNGNEGNGGEGENNSNGDNNSNQEESVPIVGAWMRNDNAEKLVFEKDGQYFAYINNDREGGWHESERGHYIYHDLSRTLWIETIGEDEDKSAEYKCIFGDDGDMTLWSLDNKSRKFKRI